MASMMNDQLMKQQQQNIGLLIADVSRLMRKAFSAQLLLTDNPLTFAQTRALIYVSRFEGVRQIDLADRLEVTPITLARLIDQLVEHDLVERRAAPDDRRAYQIFLRPAAEAHLATIRHAGDHIKTKALSGLDQEAVIATLMAMRQNLSDG